VARRLLLEQNLSQKVRSDAAGLSCFHGLPKLSKRQKEVLNILAIAVMFLAWPGPLQRWMSFTRLQTQIVERCWIALPPLKLLSVS
jgi:hypothetical protein